MRNKFYDDKRDATPHRHNGQKVEKRLLNFYRKYIIKYRFVVYLSGCSKDRELNKYRLKVVRRLLFSVQNFNKIRKTFRHRDSEKHF